MADRFTIGFIALSAFWLASCTGAPDTALVLAQPAAEAMSRLEDAERIVEGTGMGSLTIAPEEIRDNSMTITVKRAGDRRAIACDVRIDAATETSSNAKIDCSQPAAKAAAQDVAVQAITLVMREHVAAAVADRPYDIDGVANGLMVLIATNGPKLAAVIAKDKPDGDAAR
jgi:hypothetical protein